MIDFGGYCLKEGSQEAELRPQEADMGCRALVNGSDSCISAIIDWCFLGKSLVNGCNYCKFLLEKAYKP